MQQERMEEQWAIVHLSYMPGPASIAVYLSYIKGPGKERSCPPIIHDSPLRRRPCIDP